MLYEIVSCRAVCHDFFVLCVTLQRREARADWRQQRLAHREQLLSALIADDAAASRDLARLLEITPSPAHVPPAPAADVELSDAPPVLGDAVSAPPLGSVAESVDPAPHSVAPVPEAAADLAVLSPRGPSPVIADSSANTVADDRSPPTPAIDGGADEFEASSAISTAVFPSESVPAPLEVMHGDGGGGAARRRWGAPQSLEVAAGVARKPEPTAQELVRVLSCGVIYIYIVCACDFNRCLCRN